MSKLSLKNKRKRVSEETIETRKKPALLPLPDYSQEFNNDQEFNDNDDFVDPVFLAALENLNEDAHGVDLDAPDVDPGNQFINLDDEKVQPFFATFNVASRKAYQNQWIRFCKDQQLFVKTEKPKERHFLDYFDKLNQPGPSFCKPTTISSVYSMLNKVMKVVFSSPLSVWPRVPMLVRSFSKGYVVKKAKIFEVDDIYRFCSEILNPNCAWQLVRAVILVVCFGGGLRTKELRTLQIKDVRLTLDGYLITYRPGKEKGLARAKKFLVPKTTNGLPFFDLVHEYLERVMVDLQLEPDSEMSFLIRGQELKVKDVKRTKSKFIKKPLGRDSVYKACKWIAKVSGFEDFKEFGGHSPRRSCATHMADNGADCPALTAMLNWKNPKTAMEYIDNSKSGISKNAQMVLGGTGISAVSSKQAPSATMTSGALEALATSEPPKTIPGQLKSGPISEVVPESGRVLEVVSKTAKATNSNSSEKPEANEETVKLREEGVKMLTEEPTQSFEEQTPVRPESAENVPDQNANRVSQVNLNAPTQPFTAKIKLPDFTNLKPKAKVSVERPTSFSQGYCPKPRIAAVPPQPTYVPQNPTDPMSFMKGTNTTFNNCQFTIQVLPPPPPPPPKPENEAV